MKHQPTFPTLSDLTSASREIFCELIWCKFSDGPTLTAHRLRLPTCSSPAWWCNLLPSAPLHHIVNRCAGIVRGSGVSARERRLRLRLASTICSTQCSTVWHCLAMADKRHVADKRHLVNASSQSFSSCSFRACHAELAKSSSLSSSNGILSQSSTSNSACFPTC